MMRWGWALPVLALVFLLAGTYYLDRQNAESLEAARRQAAAEAESEAASLAEELATEVSIRIGALSAAKVQFTQVEDSVSPSMFAGAVDSVIGRFAGLTSVSVLYPREDGTPPAALPGRRDRWSQTGVREAYARAIQTRRPAATPVIATGTGQRFIVFDPVVRSDSASVRAVLAAEMEPLVILREALEADTSRLRPSFYSIFDPQGRRITTVPAPSDWPLVERPVRVADTEWQLVVAHQPVSEQPFRATAYAIRITGAALALALALSLTLLWRTVAAQQEEIARRRAAEENARESAGEAALRAAQARELSEQLESAQQMGVRLSSSHDPEEVIEIFLGGVAESVDADVAMLYTFEEEDDAAVGRRRVILNPSIPAADTLAREDFRKVRVPVALVRHLSEPAATGKPYLTSGSESVGPSATGGLPGPSAVLSVPLTIAGHLVGLGVWEVYGEGRKFEPTTVPFAQAVSAHAAAILRAAELLENVGQARERARKEAARLAIVLDQLSDGVVLFDTNGQPELVNAAAETLLGMSLRTTPAEEWERAFRVKGMQRRGPSDDFLPARALKGEHVRDARFTISAHGADRYIAASAAPVLGSDDQVRGAAVVLRDVTDEHEYAEMLRHTNQELRQQTNVLERVNDELRAATAAKDQFLAMMSHELRTPINAIIGYADLLDVGVHGELSEPQRGMVARVLDTSDHLLGLVNDLLDLTTIAAGRIDLKLQEVPIKRIVIRAADQITPAAELKDLSVEVEGEGDATVLGDETRISQILINLASNAVKFTDSGTITLGFEKDEERVRVYVHDTGRGIPEHDQERVFEEFYQVDSGLARNVGGTGLGLTISRRLARIMGGELTLTGNKGTGSRFTLELPLARQRNGAQASGV